MADKYLFKIKLFNIFFIILLLDNSLKSMQQNLQNNNKITKNRVNNSN